MLVFWLLLMAQPALAQAVTPPDNPGAARPTALEDLVADLSSNLRGNRSYANRELLRQVRVSQRSLRRPNRDDLRSIEARVDLADQRAQIGPAASICLSAYPAQTGGCARLLGALGDPKWIGHLERARPKASKRAIKQIDRALISLNGERP